MIEAMRNVRISSNYMAEEQRELKPCWYSVLLYLAESDMHLQMSRLELL